MRDLAALPKAHLHVHLEAAMRPATYAELSAKYGQEPFAFRVGDDFTDFITAYQAVSGVIRTADDLFCVTTEAVLDAAADGVVWFEPSLLPAPHRAAAGSDTDIIDIVLEAGMAAAAEVGIGFGLLVVADRHAPPAEAEALATLAATKKRGGVVGFGLVGDERQFAGADFVGAFTKAMDAGLICAPHAGELAGPDSVADALSLLHAARVQHGVRAVEDPHLMDRLRDAAICLDVCPTSNIALGVYPTWQDHPLPRLVEHGVPCSINADDPILFGAGILDEYQAARERLGMSDDQLAAVAMQSVRHSGATIDAKNATEEAVNAWLARPVAGGAHV